MKTYTVRFTQSEMGLLQRVIRCDIDCGAEDPDFQKVYEKLIAATKKPGWTKGHIERTPARPAQGDEKLP